MCKRNALLVVGSVVDVVLGETVFIICTATALNVFLSLYALLYEFRFG